LQVFQLALRGARQRHSGKSGGKLMGSADDALRGKQLAFIGQMMAGVSHEFKNHLAIIRELGGLLSDLLMVETPSSSSSGSQERLRKIAADIEERTLMAAEMCRYLSRFSHRLDQTICTFDLNEVIAEELYLLNRFARLKMIALDFNPQGDLPPLSNNPSLLQFAIFGLITSFFASLEKNGRILVSASATPSQARITIRGEGPRKDLAVDQILPELADAIAGLGATLDATTSLSAAEFIMSMPLVISEE
jgi:signal transduction histidine kinase